MRTSRLWAVGILLLLAPSCHVEGGSASSTETPSSAPSVAPAPATPVTPTPIASAEPTAVSPAPTASSADDDAMCMTAALSMERAKPHKAADAPFEDCAAGVFSHCGGGNGERGHLCSIPLDVPKTKRMRKAKPDSCCYGSD